MFFDLCNKCKRTFTNEAEYQKHLASHNGETKAVAQRPVDEIRKPPVPVPALDEDQRLEKIQSVKEKKAKLINAGIEAATMTAAEVEKRFAQEFGKKEGK